MTTYTEVFGGTNIYPSDVSYLELNLTTSDIVLTWPLETNAPADGEVVAARIMNVNCTGTGRSIYLPPADESGPGECILFNNIGTQSFSIVDATGTAVATVAAGTLWQVYMTNNSTAAGVWSSYQFGATTSSANAAALAGYGLKAITTTLNQAVTTLTLNSAYTLGAAERASFINWTGAAATISISAAAVLGGEWFCYIRNSGSSNISIDPNLVEQINGLPTLTISPSNSCMLICDGSNFFTVGLSLGSSSGGGTTFDYLAIDVSGGGSYTLNTFQLNKISYNLTGILTANRDIIVPATVQQYWITNSTTGGYTLTVKTSAGTGIVVAQGDAQILYSNGTDVVKGQTGTSLSLPVPVADGGTGATTASGARVNLGGTSTGIAVFTAADAAAGRLAIGAISTDEATALAIQYAVALG